MAKLKREYGSGIEPLTHLGQNYMVVDRSLIPEILQILRNEEQFDYCVDITAVHYPTREKQFVAGSFRPYGTLSSLGRVPRAYALGLHMPPLRGWRQVIPDSER